MLDKVVTILTATSAEPLTLNALAEATGIPRPTAHRLAVALESHRWLSRDDYGRFRLGPGIFEVTADPQHDHLTEAAIPILQRLRDRTGESSQWYRRQGDQRICFASADRPSGLRDSVPTGAVLPLTAGSAAQVLLAWSPPEQTDYLLAEAVFTRKTLATVREQGWAASVAEREAGVASVSAPVFGPDESVVGALSISGPIERLTKAPTAAQAAAVIAAAQELTSTLRNGTQR